MASDMVALSAKPKHSFAKEDASNGHDRTQDEVTSAVAAPKTPFWQLALKALVDGGPGTCHFAITSICNARCSFCNFAIDQLPREAQHSVSLADAKAALEILGRNNIRFVHFTGGEPLAHRDLDSIVRHSRRVGMSSVLITNGWLLTADRVDRLVDAGLTSLVISIDAPSATVHDRNRGLKGLSKQISKANEWCRRRGLPTTASVTMSRLIGDYSELPQFLCSMGFDAVTFSYPLSALRSSYLSYRESELVTYSAKELEAAFEAVKALKKRFPVLNPAASLEDMMRHVRGEPEQFGCLGGYKFFYLDWHLDLYRCHNWDRPLCHISEFDPTKRVHDGCTACMIDCYRDDSVMQHVAVAISDGVAAAKKGQLREAWRHWSDRRNFISLKAVLDEAPLWRKRV